MKSFITLIISVVALGCITAPAAHASSDGFDLSWFTIDSGGGTSTGTGFVLSGTVGQPDAGTMSGGGFALEGGFWPGVTPSPVDPLPCPADLTGDFVINVFDLLQLLASWGPCLDPEDCPEDLTNDFVVNVFDLLELLAAWGPCP